MNATARELFGSWTVEPLPCRGCNSVDTPMGSFCESCAVTERHRARVERVRHGTIALRKRLEQWPAVGSSEYLERVSPKLRPFAERYSFARGSVLLLGPSGVGKTTAMYALARRLADAAIAGGDDQSPILHTVSTSGLRLAREQRETRLGHECEGLAEARRARLLLLDELGQESAPPAWLLELLDDRYTAQAVTIATSGLTRAELEARYGSGAARRLFEPVGIVVDLFGGTA